MDSTSATTADRHAQSLVNGKWRDDDNASPIRNPADVDHVVGYAHWCPRQAAGHAMNVASAAQRAWKRRGTTERIAFLHKFVATMESNKDELARLVTLENGKTLGEARLEIDATIRDARFDLDLVENQQPDPTDVSDGARVRREPLGVVLLVTPWNFPVATIGRKLVPALALGNSAVVKASSLTPLTASAVFNMLQETSIPDGVANLVIGRSGDVSEPLLSHEALRGISFTGSTEVGLDICEAVARRDVRLQMEMGGSNAMVVLPDADLDMAVDAAITAGFTCAGQWCTSTSRIIVEEAVYDSFVSRLAARAGEIRVGDGLDDKTDMGPLISHAQRDTVLRQVQLAQGEGAIIAYGGNPLDQIGGRRGSYMEPTVLVNVCPETSFTRKEVFGPVVGVMWAKDPAHALLLSNASPFGLSFSVFTHDEELAKMFMAEAEAGICHVNLHTAYREAGFPISGWKQSGRGLPECGQSTIDFYTRVKAVYHSKP
ncbi:MAG: aldehyde dehydrogenase family protein [Planctomycetota bacterium]|jgi:aldehyde dehydrogenase (NAD+)